jgi:diguanylate cyclase (GGDEF)-like protein
LTGLKRKDLKIDELTGIYNRRAIYKILDQEIKRAERFKHPLSVMMMDVDFFKVYNDNNGHVAGDVLLQKLSKIVTGKIRDVDTLGRYGGEEFLVILPETSHENAAKIGERIRKGIEAARFKGEENQPKGQVTVSIGLVTFHGEYGHRTHLIDSADALLYKAKESGRNQLIKAYFKK